MDALTLVFGLLLSLFVTVIPAVLWSALVWWCDRYEREPIPLAFAAFAWGALPAVALSLAIESFLEVPATLFGSTLLSDVATSGAVAPVIEEVVKGLALLLVLWVRRAEFDDVLDGILYGALIGFGFAMTENLLYFMGALFENGWTGWGATVFLRSVVFGFNHAFFTAFTGAGLGYARMATSRFGRYTVPWLGLLVAIAVHALHNLGAELAQVSAGALLLSVFNAFAGVSLVVTMIGLSLRQQRQWIRSELSDEVGDWLTAAQHQALASLAGRRAMTAAARQQGGAAAERRSRLFQELATELAFRKRRLARRGEARLAEQVASLRTRLRELGGTL